MWALGNVSTRAWSQLDAIICSDIEGRVKELSTVNCLKKKKKKAAGLGGGKKEKEEKGVPLPQHRLSVKERCEDRVLARIKWNSQTTWSSQHFLWATGITPLCGSEHPFCCLQHLLLVSFPFDSAAHDTRLEGCCFQPCLLGFVPWNRHTTLPGKWVQRKGRGPPGWP